MNIVTHRFQEQGILEISVPQTGGSECIEDLAKMRLHAGVRVAAARVARRTSGLDCDVGMPGELQEVGNVRHGGGVFARLETAATA